jgi:Spy/CpxP family protein refolding chaperone
MMRSRSRWLAALALGSIVIAPAGSALAAADAPSQATHGRDWLKQRLGLTDDQAAQVKTILKDQAAQGRQLGQSLRQAQAELRQLALGGADDATLQAKREEVQRLVAQGVDLRVEALRKIGPLLTPEQREKLAQLGLEHRGHHRSKQPS